MTPDLLQSVNMNNIIKYFVVFSVSLVAVLAIDSDSDFSCGTSSYVAEIKEYRLYSSDYNGTKRALFNEVSLDRKIL